jgi:hypothetical protein
VSTNGHPGDVKPVINGGGEKALSGGKEGARKAKNGPLFCVVCASNNVREPSSKLDLKLTYVESVHGSPYGARVSPMSN